MNAPFFSLVVWHAICGRCGAQKVLLSEKLSAHESIPIPTIPPLDWSVYNGVLICPKHEVIVQDKP